MSGHQIRGITVENLPEVRLQFAGGLTFEEGVRDILWPVASRYRFVESRTPDVVIFGPYDKGVPAGPFVRVGYFCENMRPDTRVCDWAFGVDRDSDFKHPRYTQIQWHGLDPALLVKPEPPASAAEEGRTRFCNFVYSNSVPLRERFFRLLSKYKRVDAPGRSMNNMPSFDSEEPHLSAWERKRRFLRRYKFTIAFENTSYPGYHTEKLTDPMLAGSLPVYWGDARVGDVFNTKSFINAHEILRDHKAWLFSPADRMIRRRPVHLHDHHSVGGRVANAIAVRTKPRLDALRYRDLQRLVDWIVAVDSDPELYRQYVEQPWLPGNVPPRIDSVVERWQEILDGAIQQRHDGRRSH